MSFFSSGAQDVIVKGGFLSDSLKIGEQTAFYLSAKYPSNLTVLFPDSTFSFSPFEYEKKKFFATKTTNSISSDSTLYYLTTFEVDRVQHLELPVFIVTQQDCTSVNSPTDSIYITQLVAAVPDSIPVDKLPLKINTAYQKVFFEFNTWVLIIGIAVLIAVVVIIWLLFGKKIAKYFRARRLVKNHSKFLETYNSMLRQLQQTFSVPRAEAAVVAWKKYMEQLDTIPYTKLTTKETLHAVKDDWLASKLKMVDRSIYGHDTSVLEPLESLKQYADRRFSKKLDEVRHGA